ncbi:MAG TPA: hypothetical protein PKD53_00530 [Chloroflexaceae bacterium]|nr:hypothetical protein [Chloroflexaceae bacterium]
MIRYNALTTLADVYADDRTLLGAVPHTEAGQAAGARARAHHAAGDPMAARRAITLAGGTPNTPALRRGVESWETSVTRHQRQLALARARVYRREA